MSSPYRARLLDSPERRAPYEFDAPEHEIMSNHVTLNLFKAFTSQFHFILTLKDVKSTFLIRFALMSILLVIV